MQGLSQEIDMSISLIIGDTGLVDTHPWLNLLGYVLSQKQVLSQGQVFNRYVFPTRFTMVKNWI